MSKGAVDYSDLVSKLDDSGLGELITAAAEERRWRLQKTEDIDFLIGEALDNGFTTSGDPNPPQLLDSGLVVLTGTVKDLSAVKHRCSLWTIRTSREQPDYWFWVEDTDSYMGSDTFKIGDVRKTAAVHIATPGMLLTRQGMTKSGDEGHSRNSAQIWEVKSDAGGKMSLAPVEVSARKLPPPPAASSY